jgi:hypothetical protein
MERSRLKQQRKTAEAEARRWAREKQLLDEIMEDTPQPRTEDCSHNGGFGLESVALAQIAVQVFQMIYQQI